MSTLERRRLASSFVEGLAKWKGLIVCRCRNCFFLFPFFVIFPFSFGLDAFVKERMVSVDVQAVGLMSF